MVSMRDYATVSTAAVVGAVWAGHSYAGAFVGPTQASRGSQAVMPEVASTLPLKSLGSTGLIAYGAGFGAMAALVHSARRSKVARRGVDRGGRNEIVVAENLDIKKVSYLQTLPPKSMYSEAVVREILAQADKSEWENPREGTQLYILKAFAETYGEGKATKMGWWDYFAYKVSIPNNLKDLEPAYFNWNQVYDENEFEFPSEAVLRGELPLWLPGYVFPFDTGATLKWRGATEPMAGDTIRTVVTDGRWSKNFVDNWAFYRQGLEPWQRGLEIGLGHGYFLIGPFTALGPLRFTPEAATVGMLAACALVVVVSMFGLVFSTVEKPRMFDKPGQKRGTGFTEMINWHCLGGIGGAGFAHALITVFGNGA